MKNRFNQQAKDWDKLDRRRKNAKNIADVILKNIALDKNMHIMDFGAGTGLLSEYLSSSVAKITAVDNSYGMIDEFLAKEFSCKTDALCVDIFKDSIDIKFNAIVSSMTIHHIKDIEKLFEKFYSLLEDNGYIAIADLDKEDGSFHSNNDGGFHFGFDFNELVLIAKKVGFKDISIHSCKEIEKPHKKFEVLSIIAKK